MISLLLPYWDRQKAANKALATLEQYAGKLDLEVVIIDDGNKVPFEAPPTNLNLVIVRLPLKDEPKAPTRAWNEGARVATGDVLALSCIEVLHDRGPVLIEMLEELKRAGPKGYVLAAAWCPEQGDWHVHSSVEVPECPPGTGLSFCSMLSRDLYFEAGGFGEEYRDGAGYEDRDFIHRLTHAGAKFIKRDDLVVTHPKTGATIAWGAHKFERNKAIFERTWLQRIKRTFVCVNAQNYCGRGAQYVNTLFDMVKRTLPGGVIFRFVCITDDPKDLHEGIETIALPKDIEGWYGKLFMFKRGLFPDGERLIYFDLDTIIWSSINEIIRYEGDFATLEDFYFPERVGPAVMMWRAGGPASAIWQQWVDQGRPESSLGDLTWINELDGGEFARRADKLQALFPDAFVSFKRDCAPMPPKGARVVCFHGRPRPHEAAETDEWVRMIWREGGAAQANLEVVANTDYVQTASNIKAACKLKHDWLPFEAARAGSVAIVGGGPSLVTMLDELRAHQRDGMLVFATNGAHDYLVEREIIPDAHVIIDARPENARFISKRARSYFLASQCHPDIFAKAKGHVTIVHMNTRGVLNSIPQSLKPINLISSGSTVGLAAIAIAYCLGYRSLYVYGMDSSYEEQRHAYPQGLNDHDRVVEAIAGGKKFKCAPWMIAQVEHFQKLAAELAAADCEIHVRSKGMLGHVTWVWMNQQEAAA